MQLTEAGFIFRLDGPGLASKGLEVHCCKGQARLLPAGIKASLVAAQSAESALGRSWATARDLGMSKARADLDWEAMTSFALDPDLVRKRRAMHSKEKECAMCGAMCAMRMMTGDNFQCPSDKDGKTA